MFFAGWTFLSIAESLLNNKGADSSWYFTIFKIRILQTQIIFIRLKVTIFDFSQLILNTFEFLLKSVKGGGFLLPADGSFELFVQKEVEMLILMQVFVHINNKLIFIIIVFRNLLSCRRILSTTPSHLNFTTIELGAVTMPLLGCSPPIESMIIAVLYFTAFSLLISLCIRRPGWGGIPRMFLRSTLSTPDVAIWSRSNSRRRGKGWGRTVLFLWGFCRNRSRLPFLTRCFELYEDLKI